MSKRTSSPFFDQVVDRITADVQARLAQRRSSMDDELRHLSEALRLAQQQRDAGEVDNAMMAAYTAGLIYGRLEKKVQSQRGGTAAARIKAGDAQNQSKVISEWWGKLYENAKKKPKPATVVKRIARKTGRSEGHVRRVLNEHILK